VGSEGRTRTRLDPETRREQIVSAAEAVFQGRDPADVTFEEIAIAAGVSRALVYNYFGDKSGLIAAVYLRSFERLDDTLRAALTGISTPSERLRLVITCYLEVPSPRCPAVPRHEAAQQGDGPAIGCHQAVCGAASLVNDRTRFRH
jgi:AcrR family transcriptional regulator